MMTSPDRKSAGLAATRAGVIALIAVLAAACSHAPSPSAATGHRFEAYIRWTSYGIPHVTAADSGSLGYGVAYATATDGICVIAREVATANGTLVDDFGASPANLVSDVVHKALLTDERMRAMVENVSPRHAAFAAGYVAGYNRYLRDHEGRLPESCRGEAWLRSLTLSNTRLLNASSAPRRARARTPMSTPARTRARSRPESALRSSNMGRTSLYSAS